MATTDKVKLQVKMGQSTGLNAVLQEPGQLLFTTDDGLLHIDTINGAGRKTVNAYADRLNNEIASTYISSAEIDGKVITLKHADGTTAATLTTQDTNTIYSSGKGTTVNSNKTIDVDTANGITITDDKVSLATSGVTAGSYGPASNQTPAYKGTFKVPYVTVDSYGRVTGASDITVTLPAVTASDLGLANALHFLGTTSSTIADGGTQSVVVNSVTYVAGTPSSGQKKLVAGDVVLLTNTGKEFLWTGTAWEELGDESSHVIKGFTTVKGDGTVLEGSGKVGEDTAITIFHKKTGVNAKTLAAQTVTKADDGSYTFKIPNIAVDNYGHVKYSADSTITIETVAWGSF